MSLLSREDAVACARAWIDTPYVKGARVRGAGCDCATLIAEYMIEIGGASRVDLGTFSQDWFCNSEREVYFEELSRYARCVWEGVCMGTPAAARPGNIAVYRVVRSRVYNHGSILLGWPEAVHAYQDGVARSRPGLHPLTSHTPMAIFDPWA